MERIQNQFHNKETFLYSLSNMLERASYYGIRTLLVLYLVAGSLKMDTSEALSLVGWFGSSVIAAQVIGAILGDLVIGNRKAIILGGILNVIGAFCLSIPSSIGLYMGLFLVVLGGGLYSPNVIANFGKLYLNKTKLLDSAFTFFYVAIELGAFLGVLYIGYIGESYGWSLGFIVAGIVMFCSVILIVISKEDIQEEEASSNSLPVKERNLKIAFAFLLVTCFELIYEISNIRFFDLEGQLSEALVLLLPDYIWSSLGFVFLLPISFLAFILWTFFYQSSFLKLILACVLASISYIILFLIPEVPKDQHTVLYLIALSFLSISEVYINPIIHSTLTRYTKPKYLAILISLAFIPTRLFALILGLFSENLHQNPFMAIQIGMMAMLVLAIVLSAYFIIKKDKRAIL